jgi:hypothetical protein
VINFQLIAPFGHKLNYIKEMKKKKMFCLMLLLMVLGVASMNAQVLIGSENEPTPGAVLDLNNASPGYIGGLLLPRVELTDLDDITTDISAAAGHVADLKGLIVYNTSTSTEGIYVWNGSNKWEAIWKKN